ncbi:MAG: translocation/assembly module TamB domain-containing protein [Polyangiales bacterium]
MARFGRIAGKVFAWFFAGIMVLAIAAGIAVQLPPVRLWIRDQIVSVVRGSLQGELVLEDVRWPSPDYLLLSGVELKDKHGTRVAGFTTLVVQLRLRSLIAGQVEISRVEASDLYVDLAELGDDKGLLSVFASDPKKPPEPTPPPAANSGMSPLPIVIRELCIDRGELRVTPVPERALTLRRLDTCLRLRVAQSLQVGIGTFIGELWQNDDLITRFVADDSLPKAGEGERGDTMTTSLVGHVKFVSADDMAFDAWIKARGFSPTTLSALGVETDVLKGPADLDLHAAQTGNKLSYRALLASAAGGLVAFGGLDDKRTLKAHVESESLSLNELTTLELPTLGFSIDAQVGLGDPDRQDIEVEIPHGYYDRWALPKVSARAQRTADGTTTLRSLDVRHARAVLTGSGKLAADGALQAKVRLDAPDFTEIELLKAFVPDLAGAIKLELDVARQADETLVADSDIDLRGLSVSGQRAEHLVVHANVTGRPERPLVQLNVRGDRLVVAERAITQAQIVLSGGPDRYQFQLGADTDFLRIDGWAQPTAAGWDGGLTASSAQPEGVVSAQLPLAHFIPGQSLELSQLRAHFKNANALIDGKLDLVSKTSRMRVAVSVPDIPTLTQAFGSQGVPGRAELVGSIRGQLTRPAADLKLRYQHGVEFAGHPADVTVDIKADAERGKSLIELYATAGSSGVAGQLETTWPRKLEIAEALPVAQHQLDMQLHAVPLPALMDPTNKSPAKVVDGLVYGTVSAQGNAKKIKLDTSFKSRVRAARDPASVDVAIDAGYADDAFKLGVYVGDRRGQLLQLDVDADIDVEKQLAQPSPTPALIEATRWGLKAKLSERSVRDLPMAQSMGVGPELTKVRVSLDAELGHQPHAEPAGVFETRLQWSPIKRRVRAAKGGEVNVDDRVSACNDQTSGKLLLAGKWAEQKLGIELKGGTGDDESIRAAVRTRLPFDDLVSGKFEGFAGTHVQAELDQLDLSTLPQLCEQAKGHVALTAKATDLFTPRASIELNTESDGLSWDDSPPLKAQVSARSVTKGVELSALLSADQGALHLTGKLPIDVHAVESAPMVRRKDPVQVDIQLDRLSMASVLAFVPGIARVSGRSNGSLQLRGSIDAPDLRGKLALEDVSLTLPRLGQRFSHVYLKAQLDGRTLRLSDGKVRDLDGTANLAALLTLESLDAWRAEINLNARNFPLRNSGVIMGHADADANVVAETTTSKGTQVEVQLKNVAVNLSSEGFGDVQSLDPHPDFSFADVRGAPEKVVEQVTPEETPGPPTVIHVKTADPLWVRRDDFAVMMGTDITVTIGPDGPLMQGKIQLLRGYISLLGQSFDVKRGQVVLAGGKEIDPQLEITAEQETTSGKRVRVEVKGFVTAPELAFFVNEQPVTAGDAILAITGRNERGGGGGGNLQRDVANAAIGMTTGLLTLGARREFGDWIPMLAVEQGNQTRVRVGIEADRFIPKFMKGFVRGAYVEGIVASQTTQGSSSGGGASAGTSQMAQGGGVTGGAANSASGTGVLLELMLPSNFVWAGQYGPGTAWSIDLDWRP